jgi:hypothetical protein
MTLIRSTKDVDYFTQLIFEALEIIERKRKSERIKESKNKIKLQCVSQTRKTSEGKRTIFNSKLS